jgi:transposase
MRRTFALDVHKRFAEIALVENGEPARRWGRIATTPHELRTFAEQLGPEDEVVIESTSITWAIVDLMAPRAGRVVVSNPLRTRAIASAKVKTDQIDARILADLGAAEFLPEVWAPDEPTRALRRRVAHWAGLVKQRTALRNQVHAVLARNLIELQASDLFGQRGRRLLEGAGLPEHERDQVTSALRLHDALEEEIALAERSLAAVALADERVRRLMTIPGVGPVTALAIVAVIGDIARFPSAGQLVGYLGLDPRVRQSGPRPARHGHISRAGQAHARGLLVEAAHAAIRTPGPLRAFHARIKARRGAQVAACATARKLAVLCWHLLAKEEDYRHSAPTVTERKLRRLQVKAHDAGPRISLAGETTRRALERRVLEEAERAYRAEVAARGAGAAKRDATQVGPRGANAARQACSPAPALSVRGRPRQADPTPGP